jgi:hypothetical protein
MENAAALNNNIQYCHITFLVRSITYSVGVGSFWHRGPFYTSFPKINEWLWIEEDGGREIRITVQQGFSGELHFNDRSVHLTPS